MSNHHQTLSKEPQDRSTPRILFLGRPCELSAGPLRVLIACNLPPLAVMVPTRLPHAPGLRAIRQPSSKIELPIAGQSSSLSAARLLSELDCPLFEIASLSHAAVVEYARTLELDLIVTSCFPWFVPGRFRKLARLGGVNLHPSLLPKFRGPDPLFWMYQSGASEAGVTVHRLSSSLDAGRILGQERFPLEDGMPGDVLERRCGDLGGRLLARVIMRLWSGEVQDEPQNDHEASYQSWPVAADLSLDRNWCVRRARNYLVGVLPLGYRPTIAAENGVFEIVGIIEGERAAGNRAYEPEKSLGEAMTVVLSDGTLRIRVHPAVLTG